MRLFEPLARRRGRRRFVGRFAFPICGVHVSFFRPSKQGLHGEVELTFFLDQTHLALIEQARDACKSAPELLQMTDVTR